jgi:hypothetical protein
MPAAVVTCGNCSRVLDERSNTAPEQRQPCPVCGSLTRTVTVTATAAVAVAVAGTPTVHIEEAPPRQTDPRSGADTKRLPGHLDWWKLDDVWMLHVLNERGELVEGGVGDDPEAALLEVYERLIPPT